MSLTQTYYLAHTARGKLSKEAARGDHDLRVLVGHANLLDGLMLDLANAEQEQESWFNQTVKSATKASQEPKHVQWADAIPEEVLEDEDIYEDHSESDSDDDDDEKMEFTQSNVTVVDADEDQAMADDDFEDGLVLTRTSSAHPHDLPQLMHEESDEEESEDESMPPSPPETSLDAFSQKQSIATTSFYPSMPTKSNLQASIPESEQGSFFDEGFYLPQRQTAIAAY